MTTAIDVASYIKSRLNLYGEVQLQKLLYYAQAWSLAWDGTPLFAERIEAWRMGPVVPAIRWRYIEPSSEVLGERERATVDAVIEHYGNRNGAELADMSHAEQPWADVWGDRDPNDRCNDEITHEAIRRYFTELALTGTETPARQGDGADVADASEVLMLAAVNAERWRGALELLAR